MSLAGPPPEGVEQGLFGPDVFAGEEFDVQGFGDYEYDEEYYDDYEEENIASIDDYPEYGDYELEGNEIETRKGRRQEETEITSKPAVLKLKYRLIPPSVSGR